MALLKALQTVAHSVHQRVVLMDGSKADWWEKKKAVRMVCMTVHLKAHSMEHWTEPTRDM
jgi:hypothetical protein